MEYETAIGAAVLSAAAGMALGGWYGIIQRAGEKRKSQEEPEGSAQKHPPSPRVVLDCIKRRASVFPRSYVERDVPAEVLQRLLEAAMWAPYHGPKPPWRFVVLGKRAMVEMQELTLEYNDANWRAQGKHATEAEYLKSRAKMEAEITGRWGPVSYMVGITVQRQAGSKLMPMWEEECATACAVQNMHLQATAEPGLACYWSSWHSAARDSREMSDYLRMKEGDRCLGFFIVAACDPDMRIRRSRRTEDHLKVEWRD